MLTIKYNATGTLDETLPASRKDPVPVIAVERKPLDEKMVPLVPAPSFV
jgi:hypothetical protein